MYEKFLFFATYFPYNCFIFMLIFFNMEKKSPILVTGATGLVGMYVLQELVKNGFTNIHALRRKESDLSLLTDIQHLITWYEGDVIYIDELEDALEGIEKVYHCAAMVSYDSRDRKELMRTNVEGTANVVNLCLEKNIKKLLHVSSIAAIGKDKNQKTISEKSKWVNAPNLTQYAISKYLSEQEVWRGNAEGLDVLIVNPPIILGGGQWGKSSTALFKQVWDGLRFYPVGSTGFVDVRDVARFMVEAMESDVCNERFIVSGGNLSFKTLFSMMAKNMGKKEPSIKVTPFLRAIAWRIEWLRSRFTGKKVLITKETAQVSAQSYHFDNQKSIDFFNFQYTPLEKTIQETCAQLLNRQNL
jgi:nucleoside-diphosphate-sugar epimerase